MSHSLIPSVKKFYFLEYFYIFLKSVEKFSNYSKAFDHFKILKLKYGLGESKYKKLTSEEDNLSPQQINKYRYTFEQVINESVIHKLATLNKEREENLHLTEKGKNLIQIYEEGNQHEFNLELLKIMEEHFRAFEYLVEILYKSSKLKSGLLILPIYSPRTLNIPKSEVKTTSDIINYSKKLFKQLEKDIQKYLGRKISLEEENLKIIKRLIESGLISSNPEDRFKSKKYNAITKRFRDFWINYFLNDIYGYEFSMSSFDLWVYRAKQMEIVHATEFFPNFNGKVVYPTSIISNKVQNSDFKEVFDYGNKKLFIHDPRVTSKNPEKFTDTLVNAYFDLRKSSRNYFINLISLREVVCYKLKISERKFEKFLETIYKLNLSGDLKIKISLEADKLPEETKASYLKREPVMIDGKYRNIIAIDVSKKEQNV